MSIGESLADAREQAGLSVLQVSERTRIRPSIIRNIEADDYSECGGDFYARGDIRSIAEVVGADPMPLIQEYDRTYRAAGPAGATSIDELLRVSAQPERPHRPAPPGRPRRLVVLGVALVVLAGVGAFFLWGYHPGSGSGPSVAANSHARASQGASGHPGSPAAASSAPASTAPSPSASAPASTPAPAHPRARMINPASATAIGPYRRHGRGDNPQNAHLAIDGRPGTAWRTDWYTTPQFGNLYRGTGLLLDMGRTVTITGVRVLLGPAAGARFQVRVGPRPHLADLRPVARSAGPGGMVYLKAGSRPRGRYVVVWFTKLPPNAAGNFQVTVRGVRVRGYH